MEEQNHYHVVFNYRKSGSYDYNISTIRIKDYVFDQSTYAVTLSNIMHDFGLSENDEVNILSWQKFD